MGEFTLEHKVDIRLHRILYIIATMMIVGFHFIFKAIDETLIDPLLPRAVGGVLLMLGFVLTFVSDKARKFVLSLTYSYAYMCTTIYLGYMYANKMNMEYAIGYFAVFASISVVYRHRKHLLAYIVIANTLASSLFFFSPEPEVNPILFTAIAVSIGAITYFTLSSKIKAYKKLQAMAEEIIQQKNEIEEINEEITQQSEELRVQSEAMEELNEQLLQKNLDLTASISYAKRIQEAILPPNQLIDEHLPNSFILYKPKDIVSGDFYWMATHEDNVYFAAIDCTGHGVPGAFMSIVGYSGLRNILQKNIKYSPAEICDRLNQEVAQILRQNNREEDIKDGMDLALCCWNKRTHKLEFAGAYNSLYLVRNGEMQEFKGDKFSIGMYVGDQAVPFTNHSIQIEDKDMVYVTTDGYQDQFGGPKGKKFKPSALRKLLVEISEKPVEEQSEILNTTIENWMGQEEQLDDICVLGVKVELPEKETIIRQMNWETVTV